MTNAELAELRGEIFGCKIIMFNILSEIAGMKPDPQTYLATLEQAAIEGIAKAPTPATVRPQHLRAFQNAAAGIVAQALEAVRAAHRLATPQGRA